MKAHIFEVGNEYHRYSVIMTQHQWNRMGVHVAAAFRAGIEAGKREVAADAALAAAGSVRTFHVPALAWSLAANSNE